MITTGWMSRSSWDSDCARISPARPRQSVSAKTSLSDQRKRRTKDDNARRAVTALLILRPGKFNHVFCSRMRHVDFTQNGISIIGKSDNEKFRLWWCFGFANTHSIPPIGSKIILSIALGPRQVLITSATVFFDVNKSNDRIKNITHFRCGDIRNLRFAPRLAFRGGVWTTELIWHTT